MKREEGERVLRCFHTDANRPPREEDLYEFHWRCTAIFQCGDGELPYCAYHRGRYAIVEPATREQVRGAINTVQRFAAEHTMPEAHDRVRSDQLARARHAGLEG